MADKVTIKFTRAPYLIDRKGVTEQDWASIGISHPDVWFDRSNRYMVDATEFPAEVVEYFREDSDFQISTAENPKPPGPAALVARGPSGTDPELQGFADEGEGKNALDVDEPAPVDSTGENTGPTTTVGGSTKTSRKGS